MDNSAFADYGFKDRPQPYWTASTASTDYPVLDRHLQIDVAIVGGGIAGITAAYLLKQEKLRVAVLEAGRIGQGATGHTTAKITSQHDLIYSKLIKHMGKEKAGQYAAANEGAIDFIEKLVQEKQIDCDFSRQPAYVYTQEEQYIKQIEDEVEAAASLGINAAYVSELPLPFKIKAAERFDHQAQFHPLKYLLALAREIPGDGSYIFERTRAIDFHEGSTCTVITKEGFKVKADVVIIATHFPAYGGNGYYFARMYPEKSYALGIKIKDDYPGGMYITAEAPGRSIRSTPLEDGTLVIVGGEHHKTGQGPNTNLHYQKLVEFARDHFTVTDMPYRWSTQDYTTLDDLPYIGQLTARTPNIYVATGFRKWGMTNSTAGAILLKDLIVHGDSPLAPVYDPSRFKTDPMLKNAVTVNIDVAKHLVGDKLKAADKDDTVAPGEAKVVMQDGKKIGLYRDDEGKIHAVNIVCTHMGCDLAWNAAELSWDCPCHGSRFTIDGEIIEGPALKTLQTEESRFNP
ncbi:MAG: FAD-dependent oxidoreductase [Firmicutes bacterium]|nr:FAD-dependent oxidoreductase [Bacillota bacterium]